LQQNYVQKQQQTVLLIIATVSISLRINWTTLTHHL